MRSFIAINLPKKVRQQVMAATRALREGDLPVRWVEEENLHVTLKFLGEVRPQQAPEVAGQLAEVARATAGFTVTLGGVGAFPTIRRPRVLWMGVEPSAELRCLKQDVEWALAQCGFESETRAFHPHLTLGRIGSSEGAGSFRGLDETVAAISFTTEVPVRTLDLMRSDLSRTGPRYSVIAHERLQGG